MNTFQPSPNPADTDAALIDRLVDGELSEDQQRALLLRLEHEPTGWRRCALAFLEAQQWRAHFSAFAQPAPSAEHSTVPAAEPAWFARNTATMFALAASVLVAFGLGWAVNRLATTSSDSIGGQYIVGNSAPAHSPLEGVTLVVDGPNGRNSQVQIPVTENATPAGDWWLAGGEGLPVDVRRALERTGHQVRQQRELLPVQLDDGRRAVVPVDRVEIHPVGARSFQ